MAVVLGITAGVVAAAYVSGPAAAAVGSALAAAVFGMASARARALLDSHAEQREALPRHILAAGSAGRLRRVREIDDPIALGVHPAEAITRTDAGRVVVDRLPPYVPRDVQDQLREHLVVGGFVLLVGDSTAGKSRAAYEAARALLPDHLLIAPAGRQSLVTILPAVESGRRCVVWLDDLERFLGTDGLTPNILGRLCGGGDREVVILATMRAAEYDRYSAREETGLASVERDSWRGARDVLELASVVELRRKWSASELHRAGAYIDDPRIRAVLPKAGQLGLAELLAAGPQLARDWRNAWRPGAHPRGAALVAAAVDCRRVGLHDPQPAGLLTELAEHYLAQAGGPLLRPESVEEAFAWAATPCHGASSLLLPADNEHYLAFDYLIDLPGIESIPQTTWDAIIVHATPRQALDIADAAYIRAQFATAVAASKKADDHDIPGADLMRARALVGLGRHEAAVHMLTAALARRGHDSTAVDISVIRTRRELGYCLTVSVDPERGHDLLTGVVADLDHLVGREHPDALQARDALAYSLYMMNEFRAAERQYKELLADYLRSIGPDHRDTYGARNGVVCSIGNGGDPHRAVQMATDLVADAERALGADHPDVFHPRHNLADLTMRVGDPRRAAEMFRQLARDRARILGPDHRHTVMARANVVCCLVQAGSPQEARRLLDGLITDCEQILGSEHGAGALARALTGHIMNRRAFDRDARRLFDNLLRACQRLLGRDHPLTREFPHIGEGGHIERLRCR